jgi:glucose/arabinose dehydrogenase
VGLVLPAAPAHASLSGLPAGFVDELVVGSIGFPTAIAFTPDAKMLVAQKSGVVRIVVDGTLRPTNFIDISARVHDQHDRGLLGLAVHPEFPEKPYVYLLYTYDPPGTNPDQGAPVAGRTAQLMRVEADPATQYTTAKAGTEVILLGKNSTLENIGNPNDGRNTSTASCMTGKSMAGAPIEDCIPSDENSHTIGSVVFGPDGSLYVSNGDGSNYGGVDPRALRSLMLDSLAGKVLRIDSITGAALPDNPFYNPAAPNSNRSKVWSYGLRNPFRMTVHPITGAAYVGDVGWGTWEEINTGKGANFGWPCYEGGMSGGQPVSLQQSGYRSNASTSASCAALYNQGLGAVQAPVWAYDHSAGGASANAGAFYTGTTYPAQYRDALFIADYNRRWIQSLRTDATGAATVTPFGTGSSGPVQVVAGPDTNLYWVMYAGSGGQVRRIRYVGGGNSAPVAIAEATPTSGQAPLQVQFTGDRSYDVDGQPLRYSWNFGDGSPLSTEKNPTHTYTESGVFDARLTVTEDVAGGQSYSADVRVTVGNTPPLVTIVSPADQTTYAVGDDIEFSGRGETEAGDPLPASALSWELRHGHNDHYHYSTPDSAPDPSDPNVRRGSFEVGDHGDNTWYDLCLTGAAGALQDTRCVRLNPRKTPITVATEPVGMGVSYEDEGLALFGPTLINPVEGSVQTLSVSPIQQSRSFVRWDDGSTSTTRTFTVGTQPRTLTAVFENKRPTVAINPTSASGTAPFTVALTASGSDPEGDTLTYAWDAGAGRTASGPTASFTFTSAGTYPVTVTATDSLGATATATIQVAVQPGATPTVPGLVGAWGFDEGAGSQALDASGQGNTGTIAGAAWTGSGRYGGALTFDGVNDWVSVPHSASLNLSTAMTLTAWVRPTSLGAWRQAILKERPGGLTYALYATNQSANQPNGHFQIGGADREVTAPTAIATNTWTHLATSYDGANMRLYVNGTLVRTVARTGPVATSTSPLRIGGNSVWGEWFAGQLDEIRVYNRALTTSEITTDSQTPTTPPAPDTAKPSVPGGVQASVSGTTVDVSWNAATDNVAVTAYDVRRTINASTTVRSVDAPATTLRDSALSAGTYTYEVRARDAAGNASDWSTAATAVVRVDETPPTVSVTAPTAGTTVSGTVQLQASASDDIGVVGVQFRVDGAAVGAEDTTAPYSLSWNSAGVANGTRTITAVARDASGKSTTSAPVTVTVSNTGPPGGGVPGLVGAWGFDEGAGSQALDASGQGNTGTIAGAAWTGSGRYGGALTFDGVNDWVSVPHSASLNLSTAMTLTAWVRPTSLGAWRQAILKERPGGLTYALYATNQSANQPNGHFQIGGADREVTAPTAIATNTWTHLATSYDGANMRLYVNGTLVRTVARTGPVATSTSPLRIGGNSVWGEWFAGQLDEIRVYNRALTNAEIITVRDTRL